MRHRWIAILLVLGATAAACSTWRGGSSVSTHAPLEVVELRLGYFANVTHAAALIGLKEGIFERETGSEVEIRAQAFNAGPEAIEAVLSGALDASYIGPNPAINAFAKSNGEAIRIVAGATSGGAFFVVQPGIADADDLERKTVASPQLGNTQDVALRHWLAGKGLSTTTSGGGDVNIAPQANADILNGFKAKQLTGAWVPEPWATRLVKEAGGKVLVDERDEWPGAEFVTTHLVVRTAFLEKHRAAVSALLRGHIAATDAAARADGGVRAAANAQLEALTGKPLAADVLDAAWANLTFTVDPIASSLRAAADHAADLDLIDDVDLAGIYDLTLLNQLLRAAGRTEVKA